MPNYEYECPVCGGREERNRPIADRDKLAMCRSCEDIHWMHRVPAAPGFKLVGAGFHANDYKTKRG